jgi:hypothetical protein
VFIAHADAVGIPIILKANHGRPKHKNNDGQYYDDAEYL